MPKIEVNINSFGGIYSSLNGTKELNLSHRKCLKFATTVGLSSLRLAYSNSVVALAMAAYRAMAVKCCLDFSGSRVTVHADYLDLEASEKANISYWIGMTSAAVLADTYLNVPRLIHATQFRGTRFKRANPASRSLADLLGRDANGGYHVIEAKGRRRVPTPNNRNDWKIQAQTIGMIDGAPPVTRSYCIALIDVMPHIEWNDPPEPPSSQVNLFGKKDSFGAGYYKPFHEFLDSAVTHEINRGGRDLLVRAIGLDPQEEEYVFMGLDRSIVKPRTPREDYAAFEEIDSGDIYVGSDGVAIATGRSPCELR